MTATDPQAEELLAAALAAWDQGGEAGLVQFVAAHSEHATLLQRGIKRCRDMGLLDRPNQAQTFPERLDDFRLVRRIGGGGMGVVYEAEQERLGRRVALKVIRPEMLFFEGARERFRREVDAIARLSHPAIVPVLASGEHEGVPYFVMELLAGHTADEVCTALRGRDPAELSGADLRAAVHAPADDTGEAFAGAWWQVCTRLVQQVALGMRHAHLRGIVHRDLKPSNVMITPHGQAIVLDFGVAQINAGRAITRAGETPGSPAFMSPEQLRGEATDERTDVYSLAATLWQLLTLQRPFDDHKVHEQAQHGLLPSLRSKYRGVPRELELVLRTAMDRDRTRRYADMTTFAGDLAAVLQRKPITARPLSVGLRLLRWSQRHKVAATAAVALLVGAATLPTALAMQQRSANRQIIAAQQRTEQSLETSLDALQSVLVRLGNERLRSVPLAEQTAHAALDDAAQLYRRLLPLHPDHLRLRVQGGRALHTLAMSFERQGQPDAALATLQEALDVLGGDALDLPPTMLDVRAHARMSQAALLVGQTDKQRASAAIDHAERDFMAAARSPHYATEALRGRANLHVSRSLLHDEAHEPARVEAELRAAVELSEQVIKNGPPEDKDPSMLVTNLTNLAKFFERQRRDAEAQPVLERAQQLATKLTPRPSDWPPISATVAEVTETYANLLSRQQDPQAKPQLEAALAVREQLARDFPDNVEFRVRLGGTLHNLAVAMRRQQGDPTEALRLLERAYDTQKATLAKWPNLLPARNFLVNHLRVLGGVYTDLHDGVGVAKVADELATLAPAGAFFPPFIAKLYLAAHRLAAPTDPTKDHRQAALAQLQRGRAGLTAAELELPIYRPLHELSAWPELVAQVREAPAPVPNK